MSEVLTLSRARRIGENAFGILVSRFRIFERAIPTDVLVTNKIVYTSCTLYNWLRKTSATYVTTRCVDYENLDTGENMEGLWRQENLIQLQSIDYIHISHSSRMARELRERYTTYFVNEGAVS
ncbi:hypothetical protein NQ314_021227 [Rhamnusium bicolor]|uniref:Transposase n=1 Tax=Rhamnusium bicolor TaxID=1586634 RepID=A0AAV8WIZ5_9CUCU|nr:hypothetical protein NQ314_021227 [Rhamnusium bicolor]